MKCKARVVRETGHRYKSDYKVCSFRRTQFGKAQLAHTTKKIIVAIKDEMQGSRSSRNRSLLSVNEDFENKGNAAVRLYSRYYIRFSIYSTEYLP